MCFGISWSVILLYGNLHTLHEAPQPSPCQHSGRNLANPIRQRLELGARANDFFYLQSDAGAEKNSRRWRVLIEDHLKLKYTDATRKRVMRCHAEFIEHGGSGMHTLLGAGGVSPASNKAIAARARQRRPYIRHRKMACLWFELLQWYVDEIEVLRSRADSSLLLDHARVLRDRLLAQGHDRRHVPIINADFLRRWRLEYGISIRMTTVRFKVSLEAATSRVRVMLSNIFRLRRLWSHCHNGRAMRWISFDQKPSWFNNAGLRPQYARTGAARVGAREDHAGTRQRYTVMTTVQSWLCGGAGGLPPDGAGGVPPKCAVLFKAASGARSFATLLMSCRVLWERDGMGYAWCVCVGLSLSLSLSLSVRARVCLCSGVSPLAHKVLWFGLLRLSTCAYVHTRVQLNTFVRALWRKESSPASMPRTGCWFRPRRRARTGRPMSSASSIGLFLRRLVPKIVSW